MKQEMNLNTLVERFHSEDKCRQYLAVLRWPEGITCPRCGSKSISTISTRNQLDCNTCRNRFSVTSGTIFHDSHLPLWKWFATTYLMIESKKGISSNQIRRTIGVSYKTAWYLTHRIRAAMAEVNPEPLTGIVEADETVVGGKRLRKRSNWRTNKAMVLGVIERGGRVRLEMAPGKGTTDLTREMAHGFLRRHTVPELERLLTDEHYAYRHFADHDTAHEAVKHGEKEWVRGDVHTNTIEGVWSLLQRSIIGSYHKLSFKHLDAYLDELEWRFNNRRNPYLFRETLRKLLATETMPYRLLTGGRESP